MVNYNELYQAKKKELEVRRRSMASCRDLMNREKKSRVQQSWLSLSLGIILIMLLFQPSISLSALSRNASNLQSPNSNSTSSPSEYNYAFLNMPLNADAATIIEMNHGVRLYEKQSTISQSMPLVNHLMTAVLALEYLDQRTVITMSQEAVQLADDLSTFSAGGRYPVSYLLYALLLDDSNAAAYALAEEISGSHINFVTTMNNRASAIGMQNSLFTNATGEYDPDQYTNTNDLMILLRYAVRNDDFLDYFGQRDNMYTLPDGSRHYFSNDFSSAWSFSDNTVEGAILSSYDNRYTAALLLTDEIKNIRYAVIITGPYTESSFTNNRQLIGDLQNISSRISAAYESSILVARGQVHLENYQIAGQTVNLVYNETVTYTHPLGNSIQTSINTVLNTEEMTLPLSTQDIVGHVEFQLAEGSVIRVNLSSDTVILAQNDTLNYVLSVIDANQELVSFILVLFSILLLILLTRFIRAIARLSYHAWLKRKRRGSDTEAIAVFNDTTELSKPSLDSALSHRMRSKPNTVPPKIINRYHQLKRKSAEANKDSNELRVDSSESEVESVD